MLFDSTPGPVFASIRPRGYRLKLQGCQSDPRCMPCPTKDLRYPAGSTSLERQASHSLHSSTPTSQAIGRVTCRPRGGKNFGRTRRSSLHTLGDHVNIYCSCKPEEIDENGLHSGIIRELQQRASMACTCTWTTLLIESTASRPWTKPWTDHST